MVRGGPGRPCLATGGTGACGAASCGLGEARGRVGGVQGVEWRTLGRSGGSRACWSGGVVAGRACMQGVRPWVWPAEHRQMRAGGGALVQGISMGRLRRTVAASWTCWLLGLVRVGQVARVVSMSMAMLARARVLGHGGDRWLSRTCRGCWEGAGHAGLASGQVDDVVFE